MDPRIGWCMPEQLGIANDHWKRLYFTTMLNLRTRSHGHGVEARSTSDYISFDLHMGKTERKYGYNAKQYAAQLDFYQKKKRDNKASTHGLNHPSNRALIEEDGRLQPWKKSSPKIKYSSGVVG